jgi:hypothetical protein
MVEATVRQGPPVTGCLDPSDKGGREAWRCPLAGSRPCCYYCTLTSGTAEEDASMRSWKVWTGCAAVILGVLLLVGCAGTLSREDTGEARDDAAITAKVKSSFMTDPLVSASTIGVETTHGVVYLSGTVQSEQERYRAIQLVQGVAGVREIIVRNLLVQR